MSKPYSFEEQLKFGKEWERRVSNRLEDILTIYAAQNIVFDDEPEMQLAGIDTWELEVSVDTDETSDYQGAPNKTHIATMVDATATISGTYQSTGSTSGSQQAFIDELSSTGSGPSEWRLKLYGSTGSSDLYIVDGYFTSISNTGSVGAKRSFSGSFQANGGFKRSS